MARVAFFVENFEQNNFIARQALQTIQSISSTQHQVDVFTSTTEKELISLSKNSNIFRIFKSWSVLEAPKFYQTCLTQPYDIIHIFQPYIQQKSNLFHLYNGLLESVDFLKPAKKIVSYAFFPNSYLEKAEHRSLIEKSDIVFLPNGNSLEKVSYQFSKTQLEVINFQAPLKIEAQETWANQAFSKYIYIPGSLTLSTETESFLECLGNLNTLNKDFGFIFADGFSQSEEKMKIKKKMRDFQLEKNILVINSLNENEKASLLRDAYAVLLSHIDNELETLHFINECSQYEKFILLNQEQATSSPLKWKHLENCLVTGKSYSSIFEKLALIFESDHFKESFKPSLEKSDQLYSLDESQNLINRHHSLN